eukprot:9929870-Alexandrium_andersonii.AAC.1
MSLKLVRPVIGLGESWSLADQRQSLSGAGVEMPELATQCRINTRSELRLRLAARTLARARAV